MTEAKVVTVRQPFASLVAVGAKTLLDQPRPTGYRGRLLIRAGQQVPVRVGGHSLFEWSNGGWTLAPTSDSVEASRRAHLKSTAVDLPLGVVVASCELVDCVPITDDPDDYPDPIKLVEAVPDGRLGLWLPGDEEAPSEDLTAQRPFGDFTPGRWVWLLDDVRPTTERCPRCWALADKPWYPTMAVCDTCHETGGCPPVRMRGGPGLRTPEWEET